LEILFFSDFHVANSITNFTFCNNSNTFFSDLAISGLHHVHSSIPGVTIGFVMTTCSVHEDAGNISVILSVLAGTLDQDIIVTLTTMNNTAMCECRKKWSLFC